MTQTTGTRWRVEQRPWDDAAGSELRARQRDEINASYGGRDTEPGPPPSEEDVALFLVAFDPADGEAVGCGALRWIDAATAEVKRMYVAPRARGGGAAVAVLRALEAKAMEHGRSALRLETGTEQRAAQRFYEREGFRRIPPFGHYRDSPLSICFERVLS
ncbi:GNAT family N-acetyltransferase [Glycomyces tenuis]|uniref:GNAT family N-acetyltransferase n=1 Tax=Glycomyces tenuis TaxID=58116 RepID=UPI00040A122B|nr:GNAT family N-acetyltransferase [Glycomyces tenuis]